MGEPWYSTAFGAHYPALYAHRDEGEARQCLALLRGGGVLVPPMLDMGCGDGRHLAALGPEAVGLDYSGHLLAAARRRHRSAPLVRGDMRCLPLGAASFSTVLSLFTAFGYFADDAQNALPVAEAARVLRPGGHWCLDFLDGDRLRTELGDGRPHERERTAGPLAVREVRRYDSNLATVSKTVALCALPGQARAAAELGVGPGGLGYTEQVRVFTLSEIDAMARSAGLERVQAWGGYDGCPLGDGDRWLLVFRRTGGDGGEHVPHRS